MESEGIVTEAAMAAPIDDPGFEGIGVSTWSRWSNDPCYKNKNKDIKILEDKNIMIVLKWILTLQ